MRRVLKKLNNVQLKNEIGTHHVRLADVAEV